MKGALLSLSLSLSLSLLKQGYLLLYFFAGTKGYSIPVPQDPHLLKHVRRNLFNGRQKGSITGSNTSVRPMSENNTAHFGRNVVPDIMLNLHREIMIGDACQLSSTRNRIVVPARVIYKSFHNSGKIMNFS